MVTEDGIPMQSANVVPAPVRLLTASAMMGACSTIGW